MRQPLTMLLPASAVLGAVLSTLISTAGTVRADDALDAFNRVSASNFDSGGAISRQFHLNAESYLRSTTIASGEPAQVLPLQPDPDLAALEVTIESETLPFADYVAQDPLLDGVIVLHKGAIAFEAYPHMAPRQRHYAWSVTKVLTSATLASLVAEGLVDMQAPVEKYVSELAGTAWAGTSVQNIADMASGIDCRDSDGYQDTSTCVYRMESSLGITASKGEPESFIALLQGMGRHRPAGTRNEYVSANTNVLMLIIESVTGVPYADVVRTRIWERMGAEADALMSVSAEGHAYASGGLSAKLRDLARFGRVFVDGEQFPDINATMLADLRDGGGIALTDEARERLRNSYGDDLPVRAGWQWDALWDDGAMLKEGYLGQALYVDPARDLVIAWFGTGVDYSAKMTAMPAVARQLSRSGLFDRPDTRGRDLTTLIRARNAEYVAAYAAQNVSRLLALHADDVVFMSSHRPRVVGRDAMAAALAGEFSLGSSRIQLMTDEVTRAGDFAVELGRYVLALGDGESAIHDAGDYVVVWQQGEDGVWRIYRDITTSTAPAP